MTALILIHGAAGRKEEMALLVEGLSLDVTPLFVELLGHGGRPMPEAFGLAEMVDDVVAALDSAGLKRVYLLGYSFGGYISLLLTQRYPERVAGCCTLATHLVYDRNAVRQALLILNKQRLAQFGRANEPWEEAVFDRLRAMLESVEQNGDAIYENDLRSLRVPVLAMGGAQDPLVNAERLKTLAALIPRYRSVIFNGSAHPIGAVAGPLVGSVVSDFINDVESGRL